MLLSSLDDFFLLMRVLGEDRHQILGDWRSKLEVLREFHQFIEFDRTIIGRLVTAAFLHFLFLAVGELTEVI